DVCSSERPPTISPVRSSPRPVRLRHLGLRACLRAVVDRESRTPRRILPEFRRLVTDSCFQAGTILATGKPAAHDYGVGARAVIVVAPCNPSEPAGRVEPQGRVIIIGDLQ